MDAASIRSERYSSSQEFSSMRTPRNRTYLRAPHLLLCGFQSPGRKAIMLTLTYKVRLAKKEYIAENTMAFHFEKPHGFYFRPGQYLDVTLIHPAQTDAEGSIRSFSIASLPEEDHLT